MRLRFTLSFLIVTVLALLSAPGAWAQCDVRASDANGNNTGPLAAYPETPLYRCADPADPATYTVTLEIAGTGDVDWGDGTVLTGASGTVTHTYTAFGLYNIEVTGCGGTSTVPVVNFPVPTRGPNSWVNIAPDNGDPFCVPETIPINLRPQDTDLAVMAYIRYRVDWGDGTEQFIDLRSFDITNASSIGFPIPHVYQPDAAGCNISINAEAVNVCDPNLTDFGVTFGPYDFMDIDTALVDPDPVILCELADVTLTDNSIINCVADEPRWIRWEVLEDIDPTCGPFNDFQPGVVTADGFLPRDPNRTITIPESCFAPLASNPDSTYRVRMTIRNQCGEEPYDVTIRVVSPLPPVLSAVDNTCPGDAMVFTNSTPNPNNYPFGFEWDWGDGSPVEINNDPNPTHVYAAGGTYTVRLSTVVNGYNGQTCRLTDSIQVDVVPAAFIRIEQDLDEACDSITFELKNVSQNLTNVNWLGWQLGGGINYTGGAGYLPALGTYTNPSDGRTATVSPHPNDSSVTVSYTEWGRYTLRLDGETTGSGCPPSYDDDRVFVYPSSTLRWRVLDTLVCVGEPIEVRDSSVVLPGFSGDRRGLPGNFRHLRWNLDFGSDTTISAADWVSDNYDDPDLSFRNTSYVFDQPGEYWIRLSVRGRRRDCEQVDSIRVVIRPQVQPTFDLEARTCDPSLITFVNQTNVGSVTDSITYTWFIERNGPSGWAPFDTVVTSSAAEFDATLPYISGTFTRYRVRLQSQTGADAATACYDLTGWQNADIRPGPVVNFVPSATSGCTPLAGVSFLPQVFNLPDPFAATFEWDFGNGNVYTLGVSDPVPNQTFVNNTTSNQVFNVTLTVSYTDNGTNCVFTSTQAITVFPNASFTLSAPDTVCAGQSFLVEANGNLDPSTLSWNLGDGTLVNGATQFSHSYQNFSLTNQIYTIRMQGQSPSGCFGEDSLQVVVLPEVNVNWNPPVTLVCSGEELAFAPEVPNAATFGTLQYIWDFGDGTVDTLTAPNTAHTFFNFGNTDLTRTVTLRVRTVAGCEVVRTRQFVIKPNVAALFTTGPGSVCNNAPVEFTNLSSPATATVGWEVFPLGGTVPVHTASGNTMSYTFQNGGPTAVEQYEVVLTATRNGCADVARDTITVNPQPTAAFTVDTPTGCGALTFTFDPNGSAGGQQFRWDFGDGSPVVTRNNENPVSHTYTNALSFTQTFTVTLTVENAFGCTTVATANVSVPPTVTAAFAQDVTEACGPVLVNFTNNSINNATSLWSYRQVGTSLWTPFPGQAQTNQQFTFPSLSVTDTTRYRVRLIVANGACADTAFGTVGVLPTPVAQFSIDPPSFCSDVTVTFDTTGTAGATALVWEQKLSTEPASAYVAFDPGAALTHTFINTGTARIEYNIRLSVSNANTPCADTFTVTLPVDPRVEAAFVPDKTAGCGPLTVTFENTASASADRFVWDFGGLPTIPINQNALTTTSRDPIVRTFPPLSAVDTTEYIVTLRAYYGTNVCEDVFRDTIRVFPQPLAGFTADPNRFCAPGEVTFTYNDASNGGVRFDWDLDGDGTIDTVRYDRTPLTWSYDNTTGTDQAYNVTVIAYSAAGCFDAAVRPVTVRPRVTAAFAPVAPDCSPVVTQLVNQSTNANRFEWRIKDLTTNFTNEITQTGAPQPLNYTFENFSATDVRQFEVTLTAGNVSPQLTCEAVYVDTVAVYPTPNADLQVAYLPDQCTPALTALTFTGTHVPGNTYRWYFGDGDSLTTSFPVDSVTHTYVHNPTSAPFTDTVFLARVVVISAQGCADTVTRPVQIAPQLTAAFAPIAPDCAPYEVTFDPTGTAGATRYTWEVIAPNGVSQTLNGVSPTYTFDNPSATDSMVYTVRFTAVNENTNVADCRQRIIERQVTVHPRPRPNFVLSPPTGCAPLTVNFTHSFPANPQAPAGATYAWYFDGDVTPDSTSTSAPANFSRTFLHGGGLAPDTIPVSLTISTPQGCDSTLTREVIVYPELIPAFTQTPDGCAPLTVSFDAAGSSGATSYQWDFGGGQTVAGPQTIFTFDNAQQGDTAFYPVTLTVTNASCVRTLTRTVKVFPRPVAQIQVANPTQCDSSTFSFTYGGPVLPGDTYYWHFGDGDSLTTADATVSHLYRNDTPFADGIYRDRTFDVRLVVETAGGCRDTTVQTVTVAPLLQASFPTPAAACAPYDVTLDGTGSVGATSYRWRITNLTTGATAPDLVGATPFFEFVNPSPTVALQYEIRLRVTNDSSAVVACRTQEYVDTLTVYPTPFADFDFSYDPVSQCSPTAVTFSYLSSAPAGSTYAWDFDADGVADTTVAHAELADLTRTFENLTMAPVNYPVTLTVLTPNGCADTVTKTITINPYVEARFSLTSEVCGPAALTFDTTGTRGAESLTWEIFNLSTGLLVQTFNEAEPTGVVLENASPVDTAFYLVRLTVANGNCSDVATDTVAVYPKPFADFATDPTALCSPGEVAFTYQTQAVPNTEYLWDFGDGTPVVTLTDPTAPYQHTFAAHADDTARTYWVKLTLVSPTGCSDTLARPVRVGPQLEVAFAEVPAACSPNADTLVPVDLVGNAQQFDWTVRELAGNQPIFTTADDTLTYTFVNNSATDTAFYEVTLNGYNDAFATFACVATYRDTIAVFPTPQAGIAVAEAAQCDSSDFTFWYTGTTLPGDSLYWDFENDGTVDLVALPGDTVTRLYAHTTGALTDQFYTASVTVRTAGGCADTDAVQIRVAPRLVANFADLTDACHPLATTLDPVGTVGATNYNWEIRNLTTNASVQFFTDSLPSYVFQNPSPTDPLAYEVILRVTNAQSEVGCTAEHRDTVVVTPVPLAAFEVSYDPASACSPASVLFENTSAVPTAPGVTYTWTFGFDDSTYVTTDASTFPIDYPVNFDDTTRFYTVTLAVATPDGCGDDTTRTVGIKPYVEALFARTADGCAPLTVDFNADTNAIGATTYLWSFGDNQPGADLNAANPTHVFQNDSPTDTAAYVVTLTASNAQGCSDVTTDTVYVYPRPRARVSALQPKLCAPAAFEMRYRTVATASEGAAYYIWNFGNGAFVDTVSADTLDPRNDLYGSPTYENFGHTNDTISVTLTLVSPAGCVTVDSTEIIVAPFLRAGFVAAPTVGCSPLEVVFTDTSTVSNTGVRVADGFQWAERKLGETNWTTLSIESNFEKTYLNLGTVPDTFVVRQTVTDQLNFDVTCQQVAYDTIVVNPVPRSILQVNTQACSNDTLAFALASYASTGSETHYWDFGDGQVDTTYEGQTAFHAYLNTTDAIQTYTALLVTVNATGCVDSASVDIEVQPLVTAAFTLSDTAGCSPLAVVADASPSTASANFFRWVVTHNGQPFAEHINQAPDFARTFTFEMAGTYAITLEARHLASSNDPCVASVTQTVTVYPVPEPVIVAPDTVSCSPLAVTFQNYSLTDNIPGPVTYVWDFGDGSPADTLATTDPVSHVYTHVYGVDGQQAITRTVTLTMISGDSCVSQTTHEVTVLPSVSAAIGLDTLSDVCSPFGFRLTNASSQAVVPGQLIYDWQILNAVGEDITVQSGVNPSQYLTTNDLSLTNPSDTVQTFTVQFSVTWGGGQFSCSATDAFTVDVSPLPSPALELTPDDLCDTMFVNFDGTESLTGFDASEPDSIVWVLTRETATGTFTQTFTDKGLAWDSTFVNVGTQPEDYTVLLRIFTAAGCLAEVSRNFTVNPQVVAEAGPRQVSCAPFVPTLSAAGSRNAQRYTWHVILGTDTLYSLPGEQPAVPPLDALNGDSTVYRVVLVAESIFGGVLCETTDETQVVVQPVPAPSFVFVNEINEVTLPESTVRVVNTTPFRAQNADWWTFVWHWGNGTTDTTAADTVTFMYNTTQLLDSTFTIRLEVLNQRALDTTQWAYNCTGEAERIFTINPIPPVAAFEASGEGCDTLTVTFINNSLYGREYFWQFGDGTSLLTTQDTITHFYDRPGTYVPRLTVIGVAENASVISQDTIRVFPVPRVFFERQPRGRALRVPSESMQLSSIVDGGFFDPTLYEYLWDFGDGNTSTEANPTHRYREAGQYTVSLTVTNPNGCTATYVDSAGVIAEAGGDLLIPNVFTPDPSGPSNRIIDVSRPNDGNDIFYPIARGAVEINLSVYNRWGELVFLSEELGYGWDGYYRGVLAPQGVYVYRVEARFSDGRRETLVGDVTLLR